MAMLNTEPDLAIMLGNYIRECRKKSRLNQNFVAKKVGFSAQFYGRIEKGAVLPPRGTLIELIGLLHMEQEVLQRIFKAASLSFVDKLFGSEYRSVAAKVTRRRV